MYVFILLAMLLIVFACYHPPKKPLTEHMTGSNDMTYHIDPDFVLDCSLPQIKELIISYREEPLPFYHYASLLTAVTLSLENGYLLGLQPNSKDRIALVNHERLNGYYYMQVITKTIVIITNAIMTDIDLEKNPMYAPKKVAPEFESELLKDQRPDRIEMQSVPIALMQTDHTIELFDRVYIKSIKRIGKITFLDKTLGVCTITLEKEKERLTPYCIEDYEIKSQKNCTDKGYKWHTPCMHDTECPTNTCLNGFCFTSLKS